MVHENQGWDYGSMNGQREGTMQRKGDFTHINHRLFILKKWKHFRFIQILHMNI